jgi:sulfite reductase beta subunit-like hemoprotein
MGIDDPLVKKMHIKMSGSPNGCSQHHIADLGFYGASIKVGDRTIPAYIPHVAGEFDTGQVAYGSRLKVRIAAKRVPEAVDRWIRMYQQERNDGELFREYARRVGTPRFEAEVTDLTLPIEFGLDTMNHFIDWSRNVPYQVIRGEGECAV